MFQADVGRRYIGFDLRGMKDLIACPPSGDQSVLAPRSSHPEIQCSCQNTRVFISFSEWSALANQVAICRERIEEGTRAHVDEGAEQILIHLTGRKRVTPKRRLNAAAERHDISA